MGGPGTDPRDRAQQSQLLGERGQHLLDPLVQPLDHGREVVDVVQVQPGQQGVMVGEPPGAGHRQIRDLRPHRAAGQVGQHPRIPLAGDQRFDHVPGRERGDA